MKYAVSTAAFVAAIGVNYWGSWALLGLLIACLAVLGISLYVGFRGRP